MPALVKNISLTKKRRTPEARATLVENTKPCGRCLRERGVELPLFRYDGTDSTGKSFTVFWCSWHHSEITEKK